MRGRPPSIKEEDLLDAARDVFLEHGQATTTAKIAQRAGVSEGILFYRYKSKEALLAAVIHRETQPPEALEKLARSAGQRSVAQNLEGIIEALLATISHALPFLELIETSPASGEIRRLLFAKAGKPPPQRIVELVAGYLEAEIRLGRVRTIDPTPTARAIFGGCVDYARSRRFSRDRGDPGAFARGLVDVLARGLVSPARRERSR
jgi:AcrR family transcriptional regulator